MYIVYLVLSPLLYAFSRLPFSVLYLISDALYVLMYELVGYRKKVVLDNLELVFPKKTEKERIEIAKKFYRHFIDILIESLKSFTISEKSLRKRYVYTNLEFLEELKKNKKSIIALGSHYGNWEWSMGLKLFTDYNTVAAYNKIENPYFNAKLKKTRERFGIKFLPTTEVIKKMAYNQKNKIQTIYGLLSDQSPLLSKTFYWSHFLGVKELPVHTGGEMLAKKYDANVIYMDIDKVKRGHYTVTLHLITDNPKSYEDYEITDKFLRRVEEKVYKEPAYYLWTHKRFKHRNKKHKVKGGNK